MSEFCLTCCYDSARCEDCGEARDRVRPLIVAPPGIKVVFCDDGKPLVRNVAYFSLVDWSAITVDGDGFLNDATDCSNFVGLVRGPEDDPAEMVQEFLENHPKGYR